MKKFFTILLFLCMVSQGKSQVVLWMDSIQATPGTMVTVPIYVMNFDSIGSVSLQINYTSGSLIYDVYQNINPNLVNTLINNVGNQLFIASYAMVCISIPDSAAMVEFKFLYTGGNATLAWSYNSGYWGHCGGNDTVPVKFINGTVYSSIITSADANVTKRDFTVFPNPAIDFLNITIPSETYSALHLGIYDLLGRRVYQESYNLTKGDNSLQIQTGNFSPGFYALHLESPDGKIACKKISINR